MEPNVPSIEKSLSFNKRRRFHKAKLFSNYLSIGDTVYNTHKIFKTIFEVDNLAPPVATPYIGEVLRRHSMNSPLPPKSKFDYLSPAGGLFTIKKS